MTNGKTVKKQKMRGITKMKVALYLILALMLFTLTSCERYEPIDEMSCTKIINASEVDLPYILPYGECIVNEKQTVSIWAREDDVLITRSDLNG
jgi:hypothetical protein